MKWRVRTTGKKIIAVSRLFFFQSTFFSVCFLVALLISLSAVFLPIWRIFPILEGTEFIPLHYNVYFGIDRFGAPWRLLVPGILSMCVLALNTTIAIRFVQQDKLLSRMLMISAVCISVIFLTATALITLLNV